MKILLSGCGILFFSAFVLLAAEPSTTPILRIEAGGHTAKMNHIATDAAEKLVLTVGDDKTARLWELSGGRLLRVLRPPIGEGNEGELYLGALSPDGKLAAVAGWTGWEWDGQSHVYLFDTATGHLVRRLEDMPGDALDMAFSAKGTFLAAGLAEGGGLRVWESATGKVIGRDEDYGGKGSPGLSWHGEEGLVTAGGDGQVRLYHSGRDGLTLRTKAAVRAGDKPKIAKFSPDGDRIAVGFTDTTELAVVDGKDLHFLFKPEGSDGDDDDGHRVGDILWGDSVKSPSGSGHEVTLFEWVSEPRVNGIRIWPQSGRGKREDQYLDVLLDDRIPNLCALSKGRFLFCAHTQWGIAEVKDAGAPYKPSFFGLSPVASYRFLEEGFRLSDDGMEAAFSYENFGEVPAIFSVLRRELTQGKVAADRLSLRDDASGLNRPHGAMAGGPGKLLEVDEGDARLSTSFGREGGPILQGTAWYVRCYNAKGETLWKVPAPGRVLAVNLTDHDRLAVAALGDGTIRWYRADTGQELLAFLPHADRKHWVLWTAVRERMAMPMIGVKSQDVNGRVVVTAPPDDGPSKAAGVQQGDILLALAGGIITNDASFNQLLKSHHPEETVILKLQRGTKIMELPVKLGVHPDSPWVSKAIYYDCSPGFEDLIGWHVNRGADKEADFFPAARFRDQFYRPDIIDRVLKTRDVAEAMRLADEASGRKVVQSVDAARVIAEQRPPVIELAIGGVAKEVELAQGVNDLTLRYKVHAGSTPTSRVRILVDGRPSLVNAPLPDGDETLATVDITVPETASTLSVIADSAAVSSEAETLKIVRLGTPAGASSKPKLLVLAVGVDKHLQDAASMDRPWNKNDAEDFSEFFRGQEGGMYSKVETKTLTGKDATAGNILDAMDWISRGCGSKDVVMILFMGHGGEDRDHHFQFIPYDFDEARESRTTIKFEDFQRCLSHIPGRVVFFVGSCHSGNVTGRLTGEEIKPMNTTQLMNSLASDENGIVVFSAATARQVSWSSYELRNSLFVSALLEGLRGKADLLGKGKITVASLETYIGSRVPEIFDQYLAHTEWAKQEHATTQTPCVAKPQTVPDFVIAVTPKRNPAK